MLARRVADLAASSTLAITAKARRLRAQGVDVVNFAAGEPDVDTPAFVKEAGLQAIREGRTKYTPSTGIEELKRAIAKKLKDDNRLEYAPDQIVVSSGAKHAIFNALQALCEAGDEVVYTAPYWVSYPEMVKLCGARSVVIRTDERAGFRPTPAQWRQAVTPKTKLVILNSPSNPTGAVLTPADLQAVAEAVQSTQAWVLSDEIYEHFLYDGARHESIAAAHPALAGRTIVVNGVSKTFAMTGWRIGYLAGPREIIDAVNKIQDHTTSNPASISQYAALAALGAPEGREWIRQLAAEFARRRDRLVQGLSRVPGFAAWKPQGAFYVFCNISALGRPAHEVATRLLDEAQVATIPGEGFGSKDHLRLSFATSVEEIDKGIERLAGVRPSL